MRGTPSSARAAALIAGGSLVVHELRYLLAPVGASGHGGHAYLPLLHLLIALALAGACVQLAVVVARARSRLAVGDHFGRPDRHNWRRTANQGSGRGFLATWGLAATAVLAVFTGQELIEGALASARTPGLAAVFADGGWIVPLLALGAGLVVAACLRGADAVISAAARRAGAIADSSIRPPLSSRGAPAASWRRVPALADHLAGRAPPLTA
jgi:hypothetical protein